MYNGLLHAHSGLRWIALLLLVFAVLKSFMGNSYTEGDRKLNLFAMIGIHLQATIGIVLFFVSPKVQAALQNFSMGDKMLRELIVEHPFGMILAAVLLTIGHSKSKKAAEGDKKKKIKVFYTIALVLILASIPWVRGGMF